MGVLPIVVTTLITTIIGITYAILSPEKFQATATVEMASSQSSTVATTIVVASNNTNQTSQTILETPNNLVEKLKLPLFYSGMSVEDCGLTGSASPNQALANGIKSSIIKNTSYVAISFLASSPSNATKCLNAVIRDIKTNQESIIEPIIAYKKTQLNLLKSQLDEVNKIQNRSSYFYSKDALVNEIDNLNLQISTIKNASILTPIYAPSARTEPRRTEIILMFVFAGILFSLLGLFARKMWLDFRIHLTP